MNFSQMKLGKKAPRHDPRTLRLGNYIKALPPPPLNAGYVDNVSNWPMMLNDSIGDCTIACAGHMIEQWTTYAGKTFIPSDAQILNAYEAVSGYNPNDPNSDNGAVVLDVLKYWKNSGIAGHKIVAFMSVDPKNHTEVKQAVQIFGNVYLGVALPISAQNPISGLNGNLVWSMPQGGAFGDGTPGSWGGHAIPMVGYGVDSAGNTGSEIITWGQVFDMTWGFNDLYVEECWAVVSQDWIEANGTSPSGFNLQQLQADLSAL